jgi:phosphate/sulfate permease
MTLAIIFENKILMLISLLIGSVIFVNGWTDAPNAITASVSTGALKMRTAVCIAALFNFIGAFVMGIAKVFAFPASATNERVKSKVFS